uniref:acetate--CoA ligase n=1 Tax=Knipowitschia caucasica TaxID=637954 RepID=A0AAV2J5U0_KNICA
MRNNNTHIYHVMSHVNTHIYDVMSHDNTHIYHVMRNNNTHIYHVMSHVKTHIYDVMSHDNTHIYDVMSHDNTHIYDVMRNNNTHIYDVMSHDNTHIYDVMSHDNTHISQVMRNNNTHIYDVMSHNTHVYDVMRVKKGDRVSIYLPMVPELVCSMLSCARIGAVHSVVFAGFSSESLCERIIDAQSSVLITADGVYRGEKLINLKQIVDEALEKCKERGSSTVTKCLVVKHPALRTKDGAACNKLQV